MATEEEAFRAGFASGYKNGRVSELTASQIEGNAKDAYRTWQEGQETKSHHFGAVIPPEGVKHTEKKK